MSTLNLHSVSSFVSFLDYLRAHQPGDESMILVNDRHNSTGEFVDRFGQTIGLNADFDGTVHPSNQWRAVRELMTPKSIADEAKDLQGYLSRKRHDNAEDISFILRSVERMRGITAPNIRNLVRSLPPRPSAMELISGFDPQNVAITSFGTQDLIREWLIFHRAKKDLSMVAIFALRLAWKQSPRGYVIDGCFPETVVTDGNKGYVRDIFCARRQIKPSQLLVLGDAPTDVLMMDLENVGVLIIPKIDPDPGRMSYRLAGLQKLWPRVSAVLLTGEDGSLMPLVQLRAGR